MIGHAKNALALALLSVSSVASAGDEWIEISSTDTRTFSGKSDSFAVTTTRGGEVVASIIGRDFDKESGQIIVEKWYVAVDDCRKGYGHLVTLDIDGNFKFENSFAEGSGSVASRIAELICAVDKRIREESAEKSI